MSRKTFACAGAAALVLGAGSLAFTTAALTGAGTSHWLLDGSANQFDLKTAGSVTTGWVPTPADWQQGNPSPVEIEIGDGAQSQGLGPGHSVSATVAVINASPGDLDGMIAVHLVDPDPHGDEIDPTTGRYVDLFDQLQFTISDAGTVIADGLTAEAFNALDWAWPDPVARDDHRTLDVTITLPAEVDDRWQGARTSVQFAFSGESA